MTSRTLVRIAVAAGAALFATVAAASPALADVTGVPINPGNIPTTAKAFHPETQECSSELGGGPFPGDDVWVFNLPDQSRDFVSITAEFATDHGPVTVLIDPGKSDGDDIVRQGTSKAWVKTTAGWTLTGATAVVTGDPVGDHGKPLEFVLTHTCPASGPTPSESSSSDGGGDGDGGGGGDGGNGGGGGGGGPSLPITGERLAWLITVGLALIGAGGALVVLRRRRDTIFRA
jgi:LPXTG-motif cell wall-anchored protein